MTVYFLVLPNARCRLMGSSTFSAPCVHWPRHRRANRPLSDPLCIHISKCGLDDEFCGTRRFYLYSLSAAPGADSTCSELEPNALVSGTQ